jgi:choline dehydrogenase
VRLRSNNPADTPIVDPNFLGDDYDLATSTEGIKISRDILRQAAIARFIRKEHFPGDHIRSQTELETYARQYGRTSYHPVGTCRMGVDAGAVVDPELRVRGVDGLRICDSSIMPRIVSSNTNAPTIMIGEKATDLILGNRIAQPAN